MKKIKWYWHVHHDMLCEPATEPIENRIDCIKKNKPTDEIKIRLKLLKPVKSEIPEAYDKAWEARDKAREAYDKAWEAYDKAREAYNKAWEAYDKAWEASKLEIESLHKIECPGCPWDGTSIFPNKEDK